MVSISNDFESQRSRWAAAQRALKDDGEKTVADLRAEIAGLEHQVSVVSPLEFTLGLSTYSLSGRQL